jgi:tRNA-splicing ligase RtcB
MTLEDVNPKALAASLANSIPAGASRKGGVSLTASEIESVLSDGAGAAVDLGWGESRDLAAIESNGRLESSERDVGERALKRGSTALGTLGSGNHFVELQVVDRVVD